MLLVVSRVFKVSREVRNSVKMKSLTSFVSRQKDTVFIMPISSVCNIRQVTVLKDMLGSGELGPSSTSLRVSGAVSIKDGFVACKLDGYF